LLCLAGIAGGVELGRGDCMSGVFLIIVPLPCEYAGQNRRTDRQTERDGHLLFSFFWSGAGYQIDKTSSLLTSLAAFGVVLGGKSGSFGRDRG